MKRLLIPVLLIVLCPFLAFAQHSDDSGNINQLKLYEDSLTAIGKKMINGESGPERMNSNAEFIKTLVRALKIPHSFNFPFDSVKSVTIRNSPDNRFRLITWHLDFDDGSYRYFGTVQMNTGEKLMMYPLSDYSPFIKTRRILLPITLVGMAHNTIRSSRFTPSKTLIMCCWDGKAIPLRLIKRL